MSLTFCGAYVTITGECFSALWAGAFTKPRLQESVATSSLFSKIPLEELRGEFGAFRLVDNKGARPDIEVLVGFNDEARKASDQIVEFVSLCVNRMRWAFDKGELDFDQAGQFVLVIEPENGVDDKPASDEQVRHFIRHAVYWRGYKLEHIPSIGAVLGTDEDLRYLRVSSFDFKRVLKLLERQGWVEPSVFDSGTSARASIKLIEAYHNGFRETTSTEHGGSLTQIYNVYGPNARVNVQSTDHSTNISTVTSEQLFSQIRKTLAESALPDSEKSHSLAMLDELEKAKSTSGFLEKYQSFIAAAANHMALLTPFIPALSKMLTGG
jgi:hypothetical protein